MNLVWIPTGNALTFTDELDHVTTSLTIPPATGHRNLLTVTTPVPNSSTPANVTQFEADPHKIRYINPPCRLSDRSLTANLLSINPIMLPCRQPWSGCVPN